MSARRFGRFGSGRVSASGSPDPGPGMSHAQWGRIERGALSSLSIEQASRAAAVVGLRLSVKLYPVGDPLRDAAQRGLLERFRRHVPDGAQWGTEVPLPIPGDQRAWDALIGLHGRRAGCEAETRLLDLQALERRLALKLRDGDVDVLILLVSDTHANRRMLEAHREDLRVLLPLDGRQILAGLHAGHLPAENGLIVL